MEEVSEPVAVLAFYDDSKRKFRPLRIKWHGRVYSKLKDVSLPLTMTVKGETVYIFNMMTQTTQLVLHFNTKTLQWILKETQEIT